MTDTLNENCHLMIVSTSKVYGQDYMQYLTDEIADFFKDTSEVLFIPYARPGGISFDEYTELPRKVFKEFGISVVGIHEKEDPHEAVKSAKGIFTGGGNTFLLLKTLYEKGLVSVMRDRILSGVPYMGSSAGSNIAGLSIGTSNDMPIVYPPSFDALALMPFNVNPHYLDPLEDDRHQGETRETRINEFHQLNHQPVIGLREGSWLRIHNAKLELKGDLQARVFRRGRSAKEVLPGDITTVVLS